MEATALRSAGAHGLRGPTPLLRLQSDERLVALTRRGQQAAYEALVARYQSRLHAFCRHMLSSKEDAEDVLQEVFAAAYNAMVADDRAINVRPWLYRIARNRSLNHLRRATAVGVDSMDVHLAEHGATTADKVHEREAFRQLVSDVQDLPETQRTALLLREIDALSYEMIAEAMETTVPSVKSLLVRARVSLAEASEARSLTCEEVREELGEVAEGLVGRVSPPVRRHLRSCERCSAFRKQLRATNRALACFFPVGPLLLLKKLVLANLGTTASAAGGGAAATAAGAGAGAGAGGAVSAGLTAAASKAAAGLAAAAIVTAGAVEVDHARRPAHARASAAATGHKAPVVPAQPTLVAAQPQPAAAPVAVAHHAADRKAALARAAAVRARRARRAAAAALADARAPQTADGGAPRPRPRPPPPPSSPPRPRRPAASPPPPPARPGSPPPSRSRRPRAPRPSPSRPPRWTRPLPSTRRRPRRRRRVRRRPRLRAAPAPCSISRRPSPASADPVAQRRARLRAEQQDALGAVGAEHEHLRADRADLPRGEVHDGQHEAPLELRARVLADLRRRSAHAELGAEVHAQLPGRAAGLGEVLDLDDAADADVDRGEDVEGRLGQGRVSH